MRLTLAAAALAAALSTAVPAHAGGEWPDGPNQTQFKVEPGNEKYPEDVWYAWLKDQWVRVPPEKIVPDFTPDGQPYLFLLADTIQCFVRPKGGL